MLVLTRKTNQSIMIGDDVEVSVLAVSRDKIRLGITAPRDVPVFRKEVYLSIKEEEMSEDQGASKHVERGPRRALDHGLEAYPGLGALNRAFPAGRVAAQPINHASVSNITTVTTTTVIVSAMTRTPKATLPRGSVLWIRRARERFAARWRS